MAEVCNDDALVPAPPEDTDTSPAKLKTRSLDELARLLRDEPQKFAEEMLPANADDFKPPAHATKQQRKIAILAHERHRRAKERAAVAVALRISGYSVPEIAKILCLHKDTVKKLISRVRQKFKLADHLDQLHNSVVPEAIDVLDHHLSKKRDKDLAVETLKGVGIFRQHSDKGGGGANVTALEINVVNGPVNGEPTKITGQIIGRARVDDESDDA